MQDDQFQDRPSRPPRPRRDDRDDDDYDRDDVRRGAPFPATVLTAGIIWIVTGASILINAAVVILLGMLLSSGVGAIGAAFGGAAACAGVFIGLIGGAFLLVGIQSVRGTAKDTLGNGIGSIAFAALVIGGAMVNFQNGQALQGAVGLLSGAALLVAGVLALMGRTDYQVWKRSQPRRRDSY